MRNSIVTAVKFSLVGQPILAAAGFQPALEIGQFGEGIRRGEPEQRTSGRERGDRFSGQREFRGLHVRGCSGRCEVIEIPTGASTPRAKICSRSKFNRSNNEGPTDSPRHVRSGREYGARSAPQ